MALEWGDLIPAGVGGGVTGFFALIMRRLDIRKFNAEIHKLQVDADKTEAETDDLKSGRLIRELDRLSDLLESQAVLIENQRIEISNLRLDIMDYAMREKSHAAETASLRQQIKNLEGAETPMENILRNVYPLEIPHTPSEFDPDADSTPKA